MRYVSAKYLRDVFRLDDSNRLVFQTRPRSHFTPKPKGDRAMEMFNAKWAGIHVKTAYDKAEATVGVDGVQMPLERVIYAVAHGDFDGEVIFRNGKLNDYRPENLVAVSFEQAKRYWSQVVLPTRAVDEPLDLDDLKSLIQYNPNNGRFFWKPRHADWFDGDAAKAEKFNRTSAGQECFRSPAKHGGFYGSVMNRKFAREKLVWMFETESMPNGIIVHIDSDPTNCRFENLKDVQVELAPENYRILNEDLKK